MQDNTPQTPPGVKAFGDFIGAAVGYVVASTFRLAFFAAATYVVCLVLRHFQVI